MSTIVKKSKNKLFRSGFFISVFLLFFVVTISFTTKIIKIDIDASSVLKNTPSNYIVFNQSALDFNSLGDKSVIFFSSYWCSTCNKISDKLKNMAQQYSSFKFYELNIEDYRDMANNLKVSLTPSIVIQNKGFSSILEDVNINDLDKIPSKLL